MNRFSVYLSAFICIIDVELAYPLSYTCEIGNNVAYASGKHESKNWTDAKQFCEKQGDQLLEIPDQLTQNSIQECFRNNKFGNQSLEAAYKLFWISNGTGENQNNWYRGYPQKDECRQMRGDYQMQWVSEPCKISRRFICENRGKPLNASACHAGKIVVFASNRTDYVEWDKADKACKRSNATLPVINIEFLQNLITRCYSEGLFGNVNWDLAAHIYWTGMTRSNNPKIWDKAQGKYTKWYDGYPDTRYEHTHVGLIGDYNMSWITEPQNFQRRYLCQKELKEDNPHLSYDTSTRVNLSSSLLEVSDTNLNPNILSYEITLDILVTTMTSIDTSTVLTDTPIVPSGATSVFGDTLSDWSKATVVIGNTVMVLGYTYVLQGGTVQAQGVTPRVFGDASGAFGETSSVVGETSNVVGETSNVVGDTVSVVCDTSNAVGDLSSIVGDTPKADCVKVSVVGDTPKADCFNVSVVGDTISAVAETSFANGETRRVVDDTLNAVAETSSADGETRRVVNDTLNAVAETSRADGDTRRVVDDTKTLALDTRSAFHVASSTATDILNAVVATSNAVGDTMDAYTINTNFVLENTGKTQCSHQTDVNNPHILKTTHTSLDTHIHSTSVLSSNIHTERLSSVDVINFHTDTTLNNTMFNDHNFMINTIVTHSSYESYVTTSTQGSADFSVFSVYSSLSDMLPQSEGSGDYVNTSTTILNKEGLESSSGVLTFDGSGDISVDSLISMPTQYYNHPQQTISPLEPGYGSGDSTFKATGVDVIEANNGDNGSVSKATHEAGISEQSGTPTTSISHADNITVGNVDVDSLLDKSIPTRTISKIEPTVIITSQNITVQRGTVDLILFDVTWIVLAILIFFICFNFVVLLVFKTRRGKRIVYSIHRKHVYLTAERYSSQATHNEDEYGWSTAQPVKSDVMLFKRRLLTQGCSNRSMERSVAEVGVSDGADAAVVDGADVSVVDGADVAVVDGADFAVDFGDVDGVDVGACIDDDRSIGVVDPTGLRNCSIARMEEDGRYPTEEGLVYVTIEHVKKPNCSQQTRLSNADGKTDEAIEYATIKSATNKIFSLT